MNARRMRRGRARSHDRECPRMIRKERVAVRCAVVEILVVYVCMEDRDRALFTKLEAGVRRDMETFRAVIRSNSRAVVLACVGAGDVEPVSDHVNWFTEIDRHGCVVRCVETIRDWLSACDPWAKLNDRRSPTWVRRACLEVVTVLICVLNAVQLSEQCGRVARRWRACTTLETARARTVTEEVDDVRINAVRTTAAQRDRVADERDLAGRRTHVDVARDVRTHGQRSAISATRCELDEEILTRRDRAAQRLFVGPARARRRSVLQRPS